MPDICRTYVKCFYFVLWLNKFDRIYWNLSAHPAQHMPPYVAHMSNGALLVIIKSNWVSLNLRAPHVRHADLCRTYVNWMLVVFIVM